jgi:Uma2 family endonuclease
MITSLDQLDLSKQYTYADYLKWRISERLELVKGYILKMAAPSVYHQKVSRNINHYIDSYFWGKNCNYFCAPFDVRLTHFDKKKDKEVLTVVQPDICVICDESKLDKRGCIGAPDLVIEILSPGNSKKEMKEKFEVYEESGVREYWLVDTSEKCVWVYTLNNDGKLIGHRPFIEDEIMNSFIFPEMQIELFKVFNS